MAAAPGPVAATCVASCDASSLHISGTYKCGYHAHGSVVFFLAN